MQDEGGASGQFANLPPHLRDRVTQAEAMGFPSDYEKALEAYYKRLAERQAGAREQPAEADARRED